jgi:hypothetical protein
MAVYCFPHLRSKPSAREEMPACKSKHLLQWQKWSAIHISTLKASERDTALENDLQP